MRVFVFIFLLAALLLPSFSRAQGYTPDVISRYYVSIALESPYSAHVKREITVQNLEDEMLLLGSSFIRTSNVVDDFSGRRTMPLNITSVKAFDENGVPIKTSVSYEGGSTSLTYEAWNPIGPHGNLTIYLEYDVQGELLSGVIFKNFAYPLESASLSISNVRIEAAFPRPLRVSYTNGVLLDSGHVAWSYPDLSVPATAEAEATYLPFPLMPYRMVYVFWASIFVILLAIRIYVSRMQQKEED